MSDKVRVHEIAKELGITSKEVKSLTELTDDYGPKFIEQRLVKYIIDLEHDVENFKSFQSNVNKFLVDN